MYVCQTSLYAAKLQKWAIRLAALFKCMSEKFPFVTNISMKMAEHHKMINILKNVNTLNENFVHVSMDGIYCSYCKYYSLKPDILTQTKIFLISINYRLRKCSIFSDRYFLQHLKISHPKITKINCSNCNEIISFPNSIEHMEKHEMKSYQCLYCE